MKQIAVQEKTENQDPPTGALILFKLSC